MDNKPVLKHWESICDVMWSDDKFPSVTLYKGNIQCSVYPDGNLKISTQSGGGHGEGMEKDCGRSADDWISMIKEAEKIAVFYWVIWDGIICK